MPEKEILIQINNEFEILIYFNDELIYESDTRTSPVSIIDGLLSSLGFTVNTVDTNLPDENPPEKNDPWYKENFIDEIN